MTSAAAASSVAPFGDIDDQRGVPASFQETQEIAGRNRGRTIVFERMVVERSVRQHCPLQHNPHLPFIVVDRGEGRDAARPHAKHFDEQIGRAERKSRCAEPIGQGLQVNAAFLKRHNKPQPRFLVLQKEALAMTAWQRAAQCLGLVDGEDRRMRVGSVGDAEGVEPGEQRIWRQV